MVNEEGDFKMISINGSLVKWSKSGDLKDFVMKIDFTKSEKKIMN